jgi:hypothetical protein
MLNYQRVYHGMMVINQLCDNHFTVFFSWDMNGDMMVYNQLYHLVVWNIFYFP